MRAALELLERDGVLAGLNLQEVADHAGVNRGLIHHYFGSRQALLRAALQVAQTDAAPEVTKIRGLDHAKRGPEIFKHDANNRRYARTLMLLALDDDREFEPIPYLEEELANMAAEKERGVWAEDTDEAAVLVIWETFLWSYSVVREPLARQLGTTVGRLDKRVLTTLGQMFEPLHDGGTRRAE